MTEEVVNAEVPETTLRDTLESAFDEVIADGAPSTPAVPASATPAVAEAPAVDRPREPDGKFAKVEKAEPAAPAKPAAKPAAAAPGAPAAAAAIAPEAPVGLARPSSWGKALDAQWKALPPDTQKYILQREGEFANGVSTYKKEWEQVKPLQDAIAPYKQILDQYKIDPAQHVNELLRAHHTLVMGTPEQKASLVARIIQQNNIPLQSLLVRDAEGKIFFNPNLAQQQQLAPQPAAPAQQPQDVQTTVRQILTQEKAQQSLAEFEAVAGEKYPHYESVREDMALLLESGKAQDLASAYDKALRLNDELWKAEQAAKQTATDAERQKQAAEAAARARRNAVSTRSSTPAGKPASKGDNKGLRSTLEDAFDEVVGGARV